VDIDHTTFDGPNRFSSDLLIAEKLAEVGSSNSAKMPRAGPSKAHNSEQLCRLPTNHSVLQAIQTEASSHLLALFHCCVLLLSPSSEAMGEAGEALLETCLAPVL